MSLTRTAVGFDTADSGEEGDSGQRQPDNEDSGAGQCPWDGSYSGSISLNMGDATSQYDTSVNIEDCLIEGSASGGGGGCGGSQLQLSGQTADETAWGLLAGGMGMNSWDVEWAGSVGSEGLSGSFDDGSGTHGEFLLLPF